LSRTCRSRPITALRAPAAHATDPGAPHRGPSRKLHAAVASDQCQQVGAHPSSRATIFTLNSGHHDLDPGGVLDLESRGVPAQSLADRRRWQAVGGRAYERDQVAAVTAARLLD